MKTIKCLRCEYTLTHNPKHLVGCGCDPDAPSWIAIQSDGRLLKMSDAKFETLTEE